MKHFSAGRAAWTTLTVMIVGLTIATLFGPASDVTWIEPRALFFLVSGSAAFCIVAATVVITLADRRELAEVGLLGSGLMAASVMPLVHGLVTPGLLYNDTAAFHAATFLSLPIAVGVATPLLFPQSTFGRWAARHWRDWTLLSLLGVFVIGAVVVAFPDLISAPAPRHPVTVAVSLALVIAIGSIALRQRRFHVIGQLPANLIASLSLVLLAVAATLPIVTVDYSIAFWWLHVAGAVGVIGACLGLAIFKRMSRSTHEVLAPVLTRDPLVAFELGLSPIVHAFVASLDAKDAESRNHVVRTAETAIRVGERFRLSPRELRELGLAAMLHDIGKVNLPDEILQSTLRLTDEQYDAVKQHPVDGEAMLLTDDTLASIAPIVRSHHERVDGRGYPDGLIGQEIPLAARIIAVCDAFDAMTNDRTYRQALPAGMALAVLNEHAGSQWDPLVIAQLVAVLPSLAAAGRLDMVGRGAPFDRDAAAGDAAAAELNDFENLLVSVDAEI